MLYHFCPDKEIYSDVADATPIVWLMFQSTKKTRGMLSIVSELQEKLKEISSVKVNNNVYTERFSAWSIPSRTLFFVLSMGMFLYSKSTLKNL